MKPGMNEKRLEQYLHRHIPLSVAMQVSVQAVDADGVTLGAPLQPNINHRDTLFGGSAAAIAILAAWSLLHVRLEDAGTDCRLVIQGSTMRYDKPITAAFSVRSFLAEPDRWPAFTRMLARKGRARTAVAAILEQDGVAAARFDGEFVALAVRDHRATGG